MALIARCNDVNANLLFKWRRLYLAGEYGLPRFLRAQRRSEHRRCRRCCLWMLLSLRRQIIRRRPCLRCARQAPQDVGGRSILKSVWRTCSRKTRLRISVMLIHVVDLRLCRCHLGSMSLSQLENVQ
ncbi:hypothetical protein [Paraburkholderia diazotrophica]|uniref:hypothetical protein n=1 Tax=Paraburkholderia diazotrophica TaxID=667676 RepID=UPI0031783E46